MFLQLLWFCSAPGEPLGKMGDHFPDQLSGPLYCRGTKIEAENRSPTFRTLHIFLNIRFADAIQRLQHFGAGATTCKPAPHRDTLWWSSTSMKRM